MLNKYTKTMSKGKLTTGTVNSNNDAIVQWFNHATQSNSNFGQGGLTDSTAKSSALAELKYDSSTDNLVLNKRIKNAPTDTDHALDEIFRVDKNGLLTFQTEVNFQGGSSVLNTSTTTIQDQQAEIGLENTINITGCTHAVSNTDHTFQFSLITNNPTVGGAWTYAQTETLNSANINNVWTCSSDHGLKIGDTVKFTTSGGGANGGSAYAADTV